MIKPYLFKDFYNIFNNNCFNILKKDLNQLKHYKIKNLINYYLPKKKLSIFDCGCHKGDFLKKVGLSKLKSGFLVDPLDFKVIKKLKLKNFKYIQKCIGSDLKKKSFKIYSLKYPEWSSVNDLGKKSIYKKKYSKFLINKKTKLIDQTTIDNELRVNNKKIDILKIDCQSTSLEILKGSKKSLNKKKFNIIIVAINLSEFYKNKKDDLIKISKLLETNGYELVNLANAHSGTLGKLDYDFGNFKIWTFDAIFVKN